MNLRTSIQRLLNIHFFGRWDLDQLHLRPGQVLIIHLAGFETAIVNYFCSLKVHLHYLNALTLYYKSYDWIPVETISHNNKLINVLLIDHADVCSQYQSTMNFLSQYQITTMTYSKGKFECI